jgi:hypothetical protein
MPLIEIHAPSAPAGVDGARVARTLNAAVAEALGSRLDAVWTIWRTIDGPYVRGDEVSTEKGDAAFGPIVHVYHQRTTEQVERVIDAIETVLARSPDGDVAIVSHGGVGTLLLCRLKATAIHRAEDQPGQGHWFAFDRDTRAVQRGWTAL